MRVSRRIRRNAMKWFVAAVILGILVLALACAKAAGRADETMEPRDMGGTGTPKPVSEETTIHEIEPDWEALLIRAVAAGDPVAGHQAEYARNQRIASGAMRGVPVTYEDLRLLAKIMTAEAGEGWPDWAVMCIGEVVLNRVADPRYPDTVEAVLFQREPIQYEPVWYPEWDELRPEESYVRLAFQLLEGERALGDPSVVYQALFAQGDETVLTYYDRTLDTRTYFCAEDVGHE